MRRVVVRIGELILETGVAGPGPAFDGERFAAALRRELERPGAPRPEPVLDGGPDSEERLASTLAARLRSEIPMERD